MEAAESETSEGLPGSSSASDQMNSELSTAQETFQPPSEQSQPHSPSLEPSDPALSTSFVGSKLEMQDACTHWEADMTTGIYYFD